MKHIKTQSAPKNWPIKRKGTRLVATPLGGMKEGIPVLIILNDILKIAKNKKEVKKAINNKRILLNHRKVKDVRNTAKLFDVITFPNSGKSYKVDLTSNGKFTVNEISKEDSKNKISKIIGKTLLKNKKLQLNLNDGRNFLQNIKCNTGDSVLISLKDKKIKGILKLKKGSNVLVIAGKHSGKKGKVENIDEKNQIVNLNTGKDKVNALTKQIIVIKE